MFPPAITISIVIFGANKSLLTDRSTGTKDGCIAQLGAEFLALSI